MVAISPEGMSSRIFLLHHIPFQGTGVTRKDVPKVPLCRCQKPLACRLNRMVVSFLAGGRKKCNVKGLQEEKNLFWEKCFLWLSGEFRSAARLLHG